MISSLSGLAPFPLLILLGIFFGAFKIFDLQNARTFNLFIFYVAIPCVIFETVTKSNLESIKFGLLGSYFLTQTITGLLALYITHKFFLRTKAEAIIWGLSVALSNHVLIILPLSQIFFSDSISLHVSSIIVMDSVILISIVTLGLEYVSKIKVDLRKYSQDLLKNPLVIAVLMSVFVKTSGINLNDSVAETVTSKLAQTTMPIGLISMGIILSYYLNRVVTTLTATIALLKLLFAPLALLTITGFFYQFNFPNDFLGTFLVSLGPCGAFSLALCTAYNVNPSEIVRAIFVTTVISFFMLTLLIGIVLDNL
jgi:hypothetical protein